MGGKVEMMDSRLKSQTKREFNLDEEHRVSPIYRYRLIDQPFQRYRDIMYIILENVGQVIRRF